MNATVLPPPLAMPAWTLGGAPLSIRSAPPTAAAESSSSISPAAWIRAATERACAWETLGQEVWGQVCKDGVTTNGSGQRSCEPRRSRRIVGGGRYVWTRWMDGLRLNMVRPEALDESTSCSSGLPSSPRILPTCPLNGQ